MAMLKLYKSSMVSCKYHTKNGKEINFIGGRYATDDLGEIAELDAEIKAHHPHIYIDTKETEVDSVRVDPLEALKKKAVAEYLAEQAAKAGMNTGNTDNSAGEGAGMLTTAGLTQAPAEVKVIDAVPSAADKLAAMKAAAAK